MSDCPCDNNDMKPHLPGCPEYATAWPSGIPGLVRVTVDPPRGREYDPEAERYVCCGSRRCWWCLRGTVRVKDDDYGQITLGALGVKMVNPSWWVPAYQTDYLAYLIGGCIKALAALEAQGKHRVPLRLTGERFDSVDAQRVKDLAGLPFTKEDEEELILLSILERQRRER